jgi:glycosyltransferase involved in cell wall biosynthesis
MKSDPISVVIPCYNEGKNIPLIISRIEAILKTNPSSITQQSFNGEFLLVNNGSTDDTPRLLHAAVARINSPQLRIVDVAVNQGYGYGILAGLKEARYDLLAWTHADMQCDPLDVLRAQQIFADKVGAGSPPESLIVKGNRVQRRLGEWLFTLGMSIFTSLVLGRWLSDINAQPKLFHRIFFNTLGLAPHDFSLDLFLLYNGKKQQSHIATLPVRFNKRIHGQSSWNFSLRSRLKTIARTLSYILSLRRRETKGSPL